MSGYAPAWPLRVIKDGNRSGSFIVLDGNNWSVLDLTTADLDPDETSLLYDFVRAWNDEKEEKP